MRKRAKTPAPKTPPLLYPILEACRILGVGRSTVYELMASGQLKSVAIGSRRLFTMAELERFVAKLTRKRA